MEREARDRARGAGATQRECKHKKIDGSPGERHERPALSFHAESPTDARNNVGDPLAQEAVGLLAPAKGNGDAPLRGEGRSEVAKQPFRLTLQLSQTARAGGAPAIFLNPPQGPRPKQKQSAHKFFP